ncbi:hypothetical protein NERG_02385 [Nematocida ausubeli]|uniref:Uncharacterized protein n=1 Tax=Nematocida ausubeli (strain ATCC PRA-371 / ERTm2) TaxID=1913371 RepID=H8ZFL4_NEMA1|nr:hypothetical protein NERG_02385 [Nematocida ausubeli]
MKENKMPGRERQQIPLKDKTNSVVQDTKIKKIKTALDADLSDGLANGFSCSLTDSSTPEEIENAYPYEEYLLENIEEIHKDTDLFLEDIINPYFRI